MSNPIVEQLDRALAQVVELQAANRELTANNRALQRTIRLMDAARDIRIKTLSRTIAELRGAA